MVRWKENEKENENENENATMFRWQYIGIMCDEDVMSEREQSGNW